MITHPITRLLFCLLPFLALAHAASAQSSVMDYYRARIAEHRAEMKKYGMDISGTDASFIRTQDVRSGFVSYTLPGAEGYEEMAYYIPLNATKFIAVAGFSCGPLCESGLPVFYELQNNKLVEKTSRFLSAATIAQIEAGMANAFKKISLTDKEAGLSQWVKVPQKGTTIQIGFMEQGGESDTEIFHLVYELTYNRNGGVFTLVEKLK